MTYDYKNLSKKQKDNLEQAFANNALEGFDNPKGNQYIINQAAKGQTLEERLAEFTKNLKTNPEKFLSQFMQS